MGRRPSEQKLTVLIDHLKFAKARALSREVSDELTSLPRPSPGAAPLKQQKRLVGEQTNIATIHRERLVAG
jgi:hypothetical protein